MLSDPCQCGQEGKPGLVIKKLRISNGLFNPKCAQRLTGGQTSGIVRSVTVK